MKKKSLLFSAVSLIAFAMVGRSESESMPLPRPLTLEAATAYAIQYNPGLARTQEQLREQEGVLVEVKSVKQPKLGIAASYSRSDNVLLELSDYENSNWTVNVGVRQILYAGGGVESKIAGQRERLEAARLAFTAAFNDLLLAVRQQFYAVLLDRELIVVQEEAMQVLQVELDNARHRRDAGTGSDFDVMRAEVALANARPPLIRARNAYRVAQDRLRALVGAASQETSATDLDVQGSLSIPHRDLTLADALSAARAHRPELLQQEHLIKAAEQGIETARSGFRPTLDATAGYEWMKPMFISTQRSHLDGWVAGVEANWNIFDGHATEARLAQAKARLKQAHYTETERSLTIDVEVRQAYSALSEAEELLTSSEKVVVQALESLRLARARNEAGTATQVDVLLAQTALTEARSNLAQAQHAYATAMAALQRAMGTN